MLSDGGVYDNLGLETVWKRYDTVLVSDGGGKMQPEEEPKSDWARHAYRVLDLVDNQVRSLRKRQVIDSFESEPKRTYWGIRTTSRITLADALPAPSKEHGARRNADEPEAHGHTLQERLINWGYAVCDAALRKHFQPGIKKPDAFPYPEAKV